MNSENREQRVINTLRMAEEPAVSPYLKTRIMQAARDVLDRESAGTAWWPLRQWASAAVFLLVAGLVIYSTFRRDAMPTPPLDSAVRRGAQWLATTQSEDGHWDPARWGGRREYAVGLTGLALMALLESGGDTAAAEAVDRAVEYLCRTQTDAGTWPDTGDNVMYNHAMAVAALLQARPRHESEALDRCIARGVRFIAEAQQSGGGWGYTARKSSGVNAGATLWQIHALSLAHQAGYASAAEALARSRGWIMGMMHPGGNMDYSASGREPAPALPAMSAALLRPMQLPRDLAVEIDHRLLADAREQARDHFAHSDYYTWYFLSRGLAGQDGETPSALLSALRSDLLLRQETTGEERGSWKPVDRWSELGGRVYTTAMASLALSVQPKG